MAERPVVAVNGERWLRQSGKVRRWRRPKWEGMKVEKWLRQRGNVKCVKVRKWRRPKWEGMKVGKWEGGFAKVGRYEGGKVASPR